MDELKIVNEHDTAQYIVIKIDNEQFGINISVVDNIVKMTHVTRVPKVASYLKGVINLRGEIIPVMSLRLKMGLKEDEITKATRIIILKLEQHGKIGFIVDEVKEVITLESSQIEKVATDTSADKVTFVQSVGKCGSDLISILDLNSLTLEKE